MRPETLEFDKPFSLCVPLGEKTSLTLRAPLGKHLRRAMDAKEPPAQMLFDITAQLAGISHEQMDALDAADVGAMLEAVSTRLGESLRRSGPDSGSSS